MEWRVEAVQAQVGVETIGGGLCHIVTPILDLKALHRDLRTCTNFAGVVPSSSIGHAGVQNGIREHLLLLKRPPTSNSQH